MLTAVPLYGRVLDAMLSLACAAAAGHDVDDRRRRAAAQHRRRRHSAEPTSCPRTCLYLITLLDRAGAAAAGPAHPHRHRAARAAAAASAGCWNGSATSIGIVCCLYFVWYGARVTAASYASGSISIKTLVLPEWWLLCADAGRVRAARDRVRVPHAPPRAGRAAAARGRGFGVLRAQPHVLADGLAAAARRLDRAAVHRHAGGVLVHRHQPRRRHGCFSAATAGIAPARAQQRAPRWSNFSLTPIPLFILMGEVLFHTGLAIKVIDGVERLIRQVPGRLAVVAVVAGHGVLGDLRLDHRDHRDARLADAAGDAGARLSPDDGDRPDHGDRRGRHADPAVGADRAARQPVGHLDLEAPDRRRRAGPDPERRLRRLHRGAREDQPDARAADADRGAPRLGASTSCWCSTSCR